jgi:hypothetical protein
MLDIGLIVWAGIAFAVAMALTGVAMNEGDDDY